MQRHTEKDVFEQDRERMIRQHLKGRGITDPRVLQAMREVRREEFVPEAYRSQSYADGPLPIGNNQTISQPYIVALMTESLKVDGDCDVLELGTGSGYQTAVLAKIARKVYTVERFAELSDGAREVLGRMGFENVEFFTGDGSCGWPEDRLPRSGLFDRVMITACAPGVPKPVLNELADGGRLVAPIGVISSQRLMLFEKRGSRLSEEFICDVRFVRLIGKFGFET